jgi:hypothetical protein
MVGGKAVGGNAIDPDVVPPYDNDADRRNDAYSPPPPYSIPFHVTSNKLVAMGYGHMRNCINVSLLHDLWR